MLYFSAILRVPVDFYATVWSLNAVDVFMSIVIATVLYIGKDDGIIAEVVKLLSILLVTCVTLHYYVRFADVLRVNFFGKNAATECFAFSLLTIFLLVTLLIVSKGWSLILKIKSFKLLDSWGHMIIALIRGYLICGLIFLGLLLSKHDRATPLAKNSVSRSLFQSASVNIYRAFYSIILENYFPEEDVNKKVFKLIGEEFEKEDK